MIDLQVQAIARRVVGAVIDGLEVGDGDALLIRLDDGQALRVRPLQLVREAVIELELCHVDDEYE